MIELKPCPFCGGEAVAHAYPEVARDGQGHFWTFLVACNKCCATTGTAFTPEMSWDAWNRRAEYD